MATNRKALAGKCEGLPRFIKPGGIDTQEYSHKDRDFQVLARRHLLQSDAVAGAAAFAEIALAAHYATRLQ
jgi:hypothetical protein